MSDPVITFQVDAGKILQTAIQDALREVKDLTIPLTLITKDWFKSNRAIFTLAGPGKYIDLTEKYKAQKEKAVGFVYPILKRSGMLEKSITDPSDSNSIAIILNKATLILGTSLKSSKGAPYPAFHQFGTKNLPIRPVIFTNGEQSSPDDRFNRSSAWAQILSNYVLQVTAKIGKVNP